MASCFGCNKKLEFFDKRANKKLILKAGGILPEGMSDNDVLCDECLEPIRKTMQEVGVLPRRKLGSGWVYVLPIFFSIIGGLIVYFALRNRDPKLAKNCLNLGFIMLGIKIGLFVLVIAIRVLK